MNTMKEKPSVVHTGLDIAKATLQLDLLGRAHTLPNTAAGHRQLVKLLREVPGAHVVCEATGGYERAVVAALQAAALPVSVLHPARARHFALAQGQRAKNDPLDAGVLTTYGTALRPVATPVPDAALAELRALVQWRSHLVEQRNALGNQAEHAALDFVKQRLKKLKTHLDQQMEAVEKEMAAALERAPQWQEPVAKLKALDGVGELTAVSVLSQMPELGRLNRGQAAGAGRAGSVDTAERSLGRPAAHWRRACGGEARALHVGRGPGPDEGEHPGEILRQAAGRRQTRQGGPHGRHAKTARADEP